MARRAIIISILAKSSMTKTNSPMNPDILPVTLAHPRSERSFWALIVTQFQDAYSDNILRNLLLAMVVAFGLAGNERSSFVSLVTFLFSMPFVLFSMTGGWLADRFSKRRVTLWTKGMEIGAMTVATVGLAIHSLPVTLLRSVWWPRRQLSLDHRSTACFLSCCPLSASPGETASSSWELFSPSLSVL
jgi:MFS family permease